MDVSIAIIKVKATDISKVEEDLTVDMVVKVQADTTGNKWINSNSCERFCTAQYHIATKVQATYQDVGLKVGSTIAWDFS